jgi:hypothetical protein
MALEIGYQRPLAAAMLPEQRSCCGGAIGWYSRSDRALDLSFIESPAHNTEKS